MSQSKKQRRGIVAGVSALAGVAAFAVGVAGVSQYDDVTTQQRDVTLVNAADDAHEALIAAQVLQNDSLFDQNVVGLQESIYYWVGESTANGGLGVADPNKFLFVDPDSEPFSTNLYNGAFTRASEAMLVSQAWQQVQWDHLLGVNQTLDVGGYEEQIADSLVGNLLGSGIDPTTPLGEAVNALTDSATQDSFSGFSTALVDLQNDLWSAAFSDMAGMWANAF